MRGRDRACPAPIFAGAWLREGGLSILINQSPFFPLYFSLLRYFLQTGVMLY